MASDGRNTGPHAAGEAGGVPDRRDAPADVSDATEREQPSALGGHVATRSGTAPTPDDEKGEEDEA